MAKALRIYIDVKDAVCVADEHQYVIAVHIPSTENVVADALSRQDHNKALKYARNYWQNPFVQAALRQVNDIFEKFDILARDALRQSQRTESKRGAEAKRFEEAQVQMSSCTPTRLVQHQKPLFPPL